MTLTRYELFCLLLLTALLVAAGVREIQRGNGTTAAALVSIPLCAWLAMLFGG